MDMDHPHQRWTRQLLHESALLPRPSTLKLISLPLVSGASLRLALSPSPPPKMRSCFTQLCDIGREGVIARENVASHFYISPPLPPPLRFVLSLMLQKGLWLLIFMRDMFFTFSMSQALFSEIKTENFFCCPRQVITFQSNKTLPILIAIWLKPTGKLIKH